MHRHHAKTPATSPNFNVVLAQHPRKAVDSSVRASKPGIENSKSPPMVARRAASPPATQKPTRMTVTGGCEMAIMVIGENDLETSVKAVDLMRTSEGLVSKN